MKSGDAMFLPSGRFHAIGAGNLLVEVQQNSDTTYRVFDWNRVDDQGERTTTSCGSGVAMHRFQ